MAKNPHFRLLALTATPGSTPDAVQRVIDGLHISRIEIRDEDSPDLKPYMHEKVYLLKFATLSRNLQKSQKIEKHIINMNESVERIQQLLAGLMNVSRVFRYSALTIVMPDMYSTSKSIRLLSRQF